MGFVIQTATPNDIPRIFEISSEVHLLQYDQFIDDAHRGAFKQHYRASRRNEVQFTQALLSRLSDPSYALLLLVTDDIVAGYISIQQDDAFNATLHSLFVDAAYQGKGYGAALMDEIVKRFGHKRLALEVIAKNKRAIQLYESFHFTLEKTPLEAAFYGAELVKMTRAPKAQQADM